MDVDSQVCSRPVCVQVVVNFRYRTGVNVQLRCNHGFYHLTIAFKVDSHNITTNVSRNVIKLNAGGIARIVHAYL